MLLIVVLTATTVIDHAVMAKRGMQALAAMLYVSNWTTIMAGASYFSRFGNQGPLDHLWSLAVEEQFYLVWPLLLLGLYKAFQGNLRRMALATLTLAVISFAIMWVLAAPGFDNTRAYEGTDTRAGALLIGATLAMVWHPRRLATDVPFRGRLVLDVLGVAGLATIGVLFVGTGEYSLWLYQGGIWLLSLATAVVVGVVVHPASLVGRVLGVRPLRWIGERSYGIYLWHLPIVAFLPAAALASRPLLRAGVQLAMVLLLSTLSWMLLEDPIRRQGLLSALHRHVREPEPVAAAEPVVEAARVGEPEEVQILDREALAGVRLGPASPLDDVAAAGSSRPVATRRPVRTRTPALVSSAGALLLIATTSLTAAAALRPPGAAGAQEAATGLEAPPARPQPTAAAKPGSGAAKARPGTGNSANPADGGAPTLRTSCEQVVHIGDSTSLGLMSPDYLPDRDTWIDAQYRKVGVGAVDTDILGARSIVERWHNQPNAQEAVQARLSRGYAGCWVIAMGINEAANQAVGSPVDSAERIDLIMKLTGQQPVLWLTARTLNSSGPYANRGMQKWNQALAEACARYPTMRVYDWASQVKDSWYITDGIHFTTKGYAERSRRIARALATAFPADGGPAPSCVLTPR
jgi:peptidoglycan/LPS O-acetylase OafA/YrhL